jgi:hypothetical protein
MTDEFGKIIVRDQIFVICDYGQRSFLHSFPHEFFDSEQ